MSTYAIYCSKNPCGSTAGKWVATRETFWSKDKPKSGMPINDAYQELHRLYGTHSKPCDCIAEVVELED